MINTSLDTLAVNNSDGYTFFTAIEEMFDSQEKMTHPSQLRAIQSIARMFNINYTRTLDEISYDYESEHVRHSQQDDFEHIVHENTRQSFKEQTKTEKSSNRNHEYVKKDQEPVDSTPQDVKDAFAKLSLAHKPAPELSIVKKVYKEYVKKYHPDIMKSKNATAKEIAEGEKRILEINIAMDIVKKYLAKV